jgi:hypothetical protein
MPVHPRDPTSLCKPPIFLDRFISLPPGSDSLLRRPCHFSTSAKSTPIARRRMPVAAPAKSRKSRNKSRTSSRTPSRSAKSTGRKSSRTTSGRKPRTSRPVKKTASGEVPAGEREVTIDRRRVSQPPLGADPTGAVATLAPPKLERRKKVNRRRQIDPTTCERDYTDEEVEFMNAIDEYKRKSGRMFPTCSEVLEVVRGLGYVKLSPTTAAAAVQEAVARAPQPASTTDWSAEVTADSTL